MLRLLFRGAEGVDHRTDHRQAEGREARAVRRLILLVVNVLLSRRPAGAAMFLRPVRRDPALIRQHPVPELRVLLRDVGGCALDLLRSEENTYELQALMRISYDVFCS